jgi:hypothetical protein
MSRPDLKRAVRFAVMLGIAFSVIGAARPAAAYTSRYTTRAPVSTAELIIIIVAAVVVVGASIVLRGTSWGRGLLGRRSDRFGSEFDAYPGTPGSMGTVAQKPLRKVKGMNDCPQCGDPITPDMAQCPRCHWHLHHIPGQQGKGNPELPAELAGLAAVSMAPLAALDAQTSVPGAGATAPAAPSAPVPAAPTDESVPSAPSEETVSPVTSPAQAVPVAPDESGTAVIGVIQHDILIGGQLAFRNGERVEVEQESPDPSRPDYKYVVTSQSLDQKFRLSDLDLFI